MAEFALAAITSIGSSLSAGAAGIGTAITGAAGAFGSLGGVSSAASILSGGATVLSVLNANRAGEAKATNLDYQALDTDMQTRVEAVQGLDRRTSLKAALVQQLGDRDVATAASGVDLSFGTASQARSEALKAGERALSTDSDTEDFRVARLRERAGNLRIQSQQARAGGLGNAAALALSGAASMFKRG